MNQSQKTDFLAELVEAIGQFLKQKEESAPVLRAYAHVSNSAKMKILWAIEKLSAEGQHFSPNDIADIVSDEFGGDKRAVASYASTVVRKLAKMGVLRRLSHGRYVYADRGEKVAS